MSTHGLCTLVVTKCDEVNYQEVMGALQLQDDPEYLQLQLSLSDCEENIKLAKDRLANCLSIVKGILVYFHSDKNVEFSPRT